MQPEPVPAAQHALQMALGGIVNEEWSDIPEEHQRAIEHFIEVFQNITINLLYEQDYQMLRDILPFHDLLNEHALAVAMQYYILNYFRPEQNLVGPQEANPQINFPNALFFNELRRVVGQPQNIDQDEMNVNGDKLKSICEQAADCVSLSSNSSSRRSSIDSQYSFKDFKETLNEMLNKQFGEKDDEEKEEEGIIHVI